MKKLEAKVVLEGVLQAVYPRRCPVCDGIVSGTKDKICAPCKSLLSYVEKPRCKKCSKGIESYEREYCSDCTNTKQFYEEGRSLFVHNKVIKNSIYKFKYSNKREYADFYVDELLRLYTPVIRSWNPQALIPVPLHKSKKIKRGFNQAEVLTDKLARKLEIPVDAKLLIRTKETEAQKELDRIQRKKNLENAFKVSESIVKYKSIILMDDIYTTGATINSCARLLKGAGIQKIYFITISIGQDF